jgi:uncharacterized FlgJ-related protein
MIYKFNKDKLIFEPILLKLLSKTFIIGILLITLSGGIGYYLGKNVKLKNISPKEKVIVINKIDPFRTDSLKNYLKQLNVKFDDIVYAQAQLETAGFNSKIFRQNNNLFGMKQAMRRTSTNKGEQYGHAYYDTWRESVLDYALYQCKYLSDIKTREEYLQYLKQNYAEDPNYYNKLLNILNK